MGDKFLADGVYLFKYTVKILALKDLVIDKPFEFDQDKHYAANEHNFKRDVDAFPQYEERHVRKVTKECKVFRIRQDVSAEKKLVKHASNAL